MVGVAGRSKACITCKKRRVACDGARPNCGQCSRSNRFCEGYDSYPVFLNRTIAGWERRQVLEETKPRSQTGADTGDTDVVPVPTGLPRQMTGLSGVWHEHFVAQFLHLYGVRDSQTSSEALPLAFLDLSAQMVQPSPLLQTSLRALSLTRVGRHSNLPDLLTSGTESYGQALRQLQSALYDEQRMYDEQTLIAVKTMVIHEGYESTTNNLEAWNAHMSAVTRLIVLRRPHSNMTPLAQAIVEEHRYPAMIQSIAGRKRNILGQQGWRSGQLGGGTLSNYQSLFDIGFDVGALADEVDQVAVSASLTDKEAKAINFQGRLAAIETELNDWYESLELETPGPLFFDAPDLSNAELNEPEVPLSFHAPSIAEQVTTFWAIRILTLLLRTSISGITAAQPQTVAPPSPEEAQQFRDLAILITRSAPYQFKGDQGQYLSLRFLFPLNVARETLSNGAKAVVGIFGEGHPATIEAMAYRDWCARYYQILKSEKGVGYARDLQRAGSKWQ